MTEAQLTTVAEAVQAFNLHTAAAPGSKGRLRSAPRSLQDPSASSARGSNWTLPNRDAYAEVAALFGARTVQANRHSGHH